MSRLVQVVALVVVLWGLMASGAAAGTISTQITSPADGAHLVNDVDGSGTEMTVTGTTSPSSLQVDLYCFELLKDGAVYPGSINGPPLATVQSTGGHFSTTFSLNNISPGTCVLKAVPHGDAGLNLDLDATNPAFGGAAVAVSVKYTGTSAPWDTFTVAAAGFAGHAYLSSISEDGIYSSYAIDDSGDLPQLSELLFHNAGVLGGWNTDSGDSRSQSVIDGRNAYTSGAATSLYVGSDAAEGVPGAPMTGYTFDPATGKTTFTDAEPLVRCDAATDPTPLEADASNCPRFVATGVRIVRTAIVDHDGAQVTFRDRFVSIDGQQHAVDLLYENDVPSNANTIVGMAPNVFDFPWEDGDASQASNYNQHASGDVIGAAPDASATAMYIWPNGGDPTSTANSRTVRYGKASIVSSIPPAQVLFGTPSQLNPGSTDDGFELAYTRTVPAGGSAWLTHVYSMAWDQPALEALTVDARAVASAPPPDPQPEQPGLPKPPAAQPLAPEPPLPVVHVASTKATGVKTTRAFAVPGLTADCVKGAGPCDDSTVAIDHFFVQKRHGKLVRRQVTLGVRHFALADGATAPVSASLSKWGLRWLQRHHRITVRVTVTLRNASTGRQTVTTRNVVLTAPKPSGKR